MGSTIGRVLVDVGTVGGAEVIDQATGGGVFGNGGASSFLSAPPLPPVSPTPPPAPTINDKPVSDAGAAAQKAVNNNPTTGNAIGAASQILTSPVGPPPPGSGATSFLSDTPSYISNKKKLLGN